MQKVQEDIQEQDVMLQKVQLRLKESEDKASSLRASFEKLCGITNFVYGSSTSFRTSGLYIYILHALTL